ncbi:MAG: hypothetical protein DME96_12820 [Verrucomicrobia bacterium]|nr:MAG: hypothetical protein DME96_12820 [Verrucomicrobiota bacterium]
MYFVTACTKDRQKFLATAAVNKTFLRFGQERPAHGGWIGAYVTMPDQLHLFVTTDDEKITLAARTKSLKNTISKALRSTGVARHWQKTFLNHLLWSDRSSHKSGATFVTTRCGLDS